MATVKELKAQLVKSLAELFIAVPLIVILRGFVLTVLWGWFVVTTFGLPELSLPAALGVALVAQFLIYHPYRKPEESTSSERIGRAVGYNLFALGIGWIVHLFI